jgi:hypothetical protein
VTSLGLRSVKKKKKEEEEEIRAGKRNSPSRVQFDKTAVWKVGFYGSIDFLLQCLKNRVLFFGFFLTPLIVKCLPLRVRQLHFDRFQRFLRQSIVPSID